MVQSVSYQRAHRSQGRPGECDATFGVAGCISSEEANTIDAGAVTTPQVDADTLADAYRRHGRLLVQRLALIVGVVAGLLPALSAKNLNVVTALRRV